MRSPEHHTKSPKESKYGKAPNLHNPKWPPNFNNLLYLGSYIKNRVIQNSGKVFLDTRRHLGWYKV